MVLQLPVRLLLVGLLLAAGLPASSGRAGHGDPFVDESLRALDTLTSGEACVEKDAADGDTGNGVELGFVFCDDGSPPSGGGLRGIPVPAVYASDDAGDNWTGLPAPAEPEEAAATNARDDLGAEAGNKVTLEVDISLPPPTMPAPKTGRPVVVLQHGFNETDAKWEAETVDGDNRTWHHSNAWFASRGWVAINMVMRGHRDANGGRSGGTTQLVSRRYEANDIQYLLGLLADHDARRRAAGDDVVFGIDPRRIVMSGGSYGGQLVHMVLADPTWKSLVSQTRLKVAAAVPKYTGTDMLEVLVPGGHMLRRDLQGRLVLPPTDPEQAASRSPIGVLKESIVAGFYSYSLRFDSDHVVFPGWIDRVLARLLAGEPYDGDDTIESTAKRIVEDSSAWYQQDFWRRVSSGLRVPVFSQAPTTDPLFPGNDAVRFYDKLKSLDPEYPISMYFGDYDHTYAQNKPKEYGDLCGADRHVCTIEDYRAADGSLRFNRPPKELVHKGINSRINRFLDHYVLGRAKTPGPRITAATTVCPTTETESISMDEPGLTYQAKTLTALVPPAGSVEFAWEESRTIASHLLDLMGPISDPVFRSRREHGLPFCISTSDPNPGVARFVSDEIGEPFTMIGIPLVTLDYAATGSNYWIAARMYDQAPDGSMTMVTRGVCRVDTAAAPDVDCSLFELFLAAWRFEAGHRAVLELTQSDTPFLRPDNLPSQISISAAGLQLPAAPASRLADERVP